MARKPKAQLHPDVAAALPLAIAAMDNAPAPAPRSRKAQAAAAQTEAPRPSKRPAPAAAAPKSEKQATKRREPKRPAPQPGGAPAPVETDAPGHEAGPQVAGDDMQAPLPGRHAPAPDSPAAQWDRATDTVRFDWPAIERTAAADGPNQGMARLLIAARADGANSRWPL